MNSDRAAGLAYSKQWTRLFKCWESNLVGCRHNRGQSACAMV